MEDRVAATVGRDLILVHEPKDLRGVFKASVESLARSSSGVSICTFVLVKRVN